MDANVNIPKDPSVGKDTLLCIIVSSNVVLVTAVDGNPAGNGISVECPGEVHISVEKIADLGKVEVSPNKRTEIVKLKVRIEPRKRGASRIAGFLPAPLINHRRAPLPRVSHVRLAAAAVVPAVGMAPVAEDSGD